MQEKSFNYQAVELKWSKFWLEHKLNRPQLDLTSDPFCMVIPPPNVTGSLHMGHAFQQTLMDVLTRYHRMMGQPTLWQMGTDHAGIATQMMVEKNLAAQGLPGRRDLGREKFTEQVWAWKEASGGKISSQLKSIGASLDWDTERFTMDQDLSKAVEKVFISLFDEGLIYRGKRMVNWDPVLKTALSDLEVVHSEEAGEMWHIRYPLLEGGSLVIATTRPETLFGDMAVAVHPDDPRYQALIGKHIQLPLCDRTIPIIGDNYVSSEFGSGCVKITPAHDFNDYQIGLRHNLTNLNILDQAACLNNNVPEPYRGLSTDQARLAVLAELRQLNLLVKTEAHTLKVPRGDRSHAVLEPYLTDQWFVKMTDMAKEALQAVKDEKIEFIPSNWTKTYNNWLENIEDWCISRQLWWGHRIPAWFDEQGKIYVGGSKAEVRQKYKLADHVKIRQDEDVLDTWFSSALWPFSSLGWPEPTEYYKKFYPTQSLITGFDIIFFWVARMIMLGLKFTGQVPFKQVYIHGLIQDQNGQKMSKTKGNVIDPLDLINGISYHDLLSKRQSGIESLSLRQSIKQHTDQQFKTGIKGYGSDALRFTYCHMATPQRHLRFEMDRLESFHCFNHKIWNASRFLDHHLSQSNLQLKLELNSGFLAVLAPFERAILSIWQGVKNDLHHNLTLYRFDLAAKTIYEFIWNVYCDWYLELVKPNLNNESSPALINSLSLLTFIWDEILRALHPFMPFITEELWQRLGTEYHLPRSNLSIMLSPYPKSKLEHLDDSAEQEFNWIKEFIILIRSFRSEQKIKPNLPINLTIINANAAQQTLLQNYQPIFKQMLKCDTISFLSIDKNLQYGKLIYAELEIFIPLKGLVDLELEGKRLSKEIEKLMQEQDKLHSRLGNTNYLSRAPASVVAAEQEKYQVSCAKLVKLQALLKDLQPS